MFRKVFVLALVVVLALALMLPSLTGAQGPNDIGVVLFNPQTDYYLPPGGNIIFFYGWGVCRAPGLLTSFQRSFAVYIELDGEVLVDGSVADTRPYWLPRFNDGLNPFCNNHPSDGHVAFWWNQIDPGLAPGDYPMHVMWKLMHPVNDMNDGYYLLPDETPVEPNGIPDLYPAGTYFDFYATLHVLP